MKVILLWYFFIAFITSGNSVFAQEFVVKDIRSFGAKGDGKTNDHEAFRKAAAYFNDRGGNGSLIISKGVYLVGKQTFTGGKPNKPAYNGENVLQFVGIKNLKIQGSKGVTLKYIDSLHFGSFDPQTGEPYEHGNDLFLKRSYAAIVRNCIYLERCSNISVLNLTLDGNSKHLILGGFYGKDGIQLENSGILIKNCNNIQVDKLDVHHFGLDGITVSNIANEQKDSITLLNSSFQYNSRQGLSWVGGNSLVAKNCTFNNTGRGSFRSQPSAGVDIEAEVGPIRNGSFINCEFVNNVGVGLVAGNGDSGDCVFTNCTFWGISNSSIWITKPGYSFNSCNIYGAFMHGYDSPDEKNATKFLDCNFEDKPYLGKQPYGQYLIESNNKKRVSFTDCNFIANKKRLCWVSASTKDPEEKYQFTNCKFVIKNADYPKKDVVAIMKGSQAKNCTVEFTHPNAKAKGYVLAGYSESDKGNREGNKIIYGKDK